MGYSRQAAAVCDGCVVGAVSALQSMLIADLNTVIMGYPSGANPGPYLRMVPGEVTGADQIPLAVTPPYSLVGYYENVWWPRMIELSKTQQGAADKTATLLNSMESRNQQARAYADYNQDVQKMTLGNQVKALGRADVLCPEPSMGQSSLALQFMARQAERNLEKVAARQVAGSNSMAAYARGRVEYNKAKIADRIQSGLCTKDGNNGTSEAYCSNTIDALENADQTLSTLLGSYVLDPASNSQSPYSVDMVKRYIENVFANRVFEPLPQSITEQKTLPPEAVQILADETAYGAALTTFQNPFLQEQADRSPVTGDSKIAALASLKAAAEQAGFTGDVAKFLINNDQISKASEEYIRYKVVEEDPSTINTMLAGAGSMSTENLLSYSIQKEMKQLALLYDIREEIKKTNLLLGAMGTVMAAPTYQSIRDRIHSVQSSGNNGR